MVEGCINADLSPYCKQQNWVSEFSSIFNSLFWFHFLKLRANALHLQIVETWKFRKHVLCLLPPRLHTLTLESLKAQNVFFLVYRSSSKFSSDVGSLEKDSLTSPDRGHHSLFLYLLWPCACIIKPLLQGDDFSAPKRQLWGTLVRYTFPLWFFVIIILIF